MQSLQELIKLFFWVDQMFLFDVLGKFLLTSRFIDNATHILLTSIKFGKTFIIFLLYVISKQKLCLRELNSQWKQSEAIYCPSGRG